MSGSSVESNTQLGRYLIGSTEILFSLISFTLGVKFSRYLYRKSSIEFTRSLAPISPKNGIMTPSQRTLSRQPTISRMNTGSVSVALNKAKNPCLKMYLHMKLFMMKRMDHWLNEGVQCAMPCLCCYYPCCLVSDAGNRIMKGVDSSSGCFGCHCDPSMFFEWDLEIPLLDISTLLAIWMSVIYLSVSSLGRFINRSGMNGNHDYCRLLAYPVYYSFHYSRFFLYTAWNIRLYTAFHGTNTAYPSWLLALFQLFNTFGFVFFASWADISLVDTSFETNQDDITYCTSTGVTWGFLLSGSMDFVLTSITFILFVYPLWTVSRTYDRSAREREEKLEREQQAYQQRQQVEMTQQTQTTQIQTTTTTTTSERDSYLSDDEDMDDDDYDSSFETTETQSSRGGTHSGGATRGEDRHNGTTVTTVSNGIRFTENTVPSPSQDTELVANGGPGMMSNNNSINENGTTIQNGQPRKRRKSKRKRKRSTRRNNQNRMRHVVVKNAIITSVMVFTVTIGLALIGGASISFMVRFSVLVTCFGLLLMYKEYDPWYNALFSSCHKQLYQCQCA